MMKTKYFLILILAAGIFSMAARKAVTADEILGRWKYTVSNVPAEYESGWMTFEQKDNKTVGYIEQAEKSEMKDLTVDQGKVTFSMDFQGGAIKYNLAQKGDTLSGVVVSQYGDFPITAVKEIKN